MLTTESLTNLLLEIAQTPAPTFAEGQRASLIASRWASFGLEPQIDAAGNVIAKVGQGGKRLALAAHLDTVFDASTNLEMQRQGKRIVGAGIGDNAAGLTVLTAYAQKIAKQGAPCELWLVASTAEEGLGDLRGIKHFLAQHQQDIDAFIAVDGYIGLLVNQAIGVRRYRVSFSSEGGHSWGNAGNPSSIQGLAEAIHELYKIHIPLEPRSTLSVGTVTGGVSVNSIAARAEFLLDLRSLDARTLEQLDAEAKNAIIKGAKRAKVDYKLELVGNRSAGITQNGFLMQAATEVLTRLGLQARAVASSTDANAAVPYNIPSIALGVYIGGNAHRLDEWVEPSSLMIGLEALEQLVLRLSQVA
jgi:tripeptide aminopeptidase